MLAWAVRAYLARSPIRRGKGFLTRSVFRPLLPDYPSTFPVRLKDGSRFDLYYRDVLGTEFLIHGSFESAEIALLKTLTRPGTCVFDVGANVGCLTVPIARSNPMAEVFAIEPLPANVQRLRAHLALNGLENVRVVEAAASGVEGTISFSPSADPALGTTSERHANDGVFAVRSTTIDALWASAGAREVSVMKIDVEGAELAVLRGARSVLRQCSPALLIEANTPTALTDLVRDLQPFGYFRQAVRGLQPWNHLFTTR
jgi:FkbM family methyltransferase